MVRVYLVGDSTVSHYDADVAPRQGWGMALPAYLKQGVEVVNAASSGRSSKSFLHEGKLEPVALEIGAGDYLLIQFGHNDQKPDEERRTEPYGSYLSYLMKYIEVARSKGATPVLVTSVERRKYSGDGRLEDTHGDYPKAMKQLAEAQGVLLLDLGEKTRRLLEVWGVEKSKELFLWYKPGEQLQYPDGAQDDTHFSAVGAHEVAALVAEGLRELGLPIVADDTPGSGAGSAGSAGAPPAISAPSTTLGANYRFIWK